MSDQTSEGRGRLALVTGGASGIGAATCEILSSRGWGVVVADIDVSAAKGVAAHCRCHSVSINVMDASSIAIAAASIESRLGAVDGLVNCAALFAPQTPPEQLDIESWDRITSTNLRGTYICNVEFGRRMASRGEGAIVNISSIGGHRPNHGHAYTTSKAGILALTQGMAGEWGRSGVRVNSITPGFVGVPRMLAAIELGKRYPVPPGSLSALGRIVRPEEVAESIAFLLSDRASAITGTDLAVDAGVLATSGWVVHGGPPPARPVN